MKYLKYFENKQTFDLMKQAADHISKLYADISGLPICNVHEKDHMSIKFGEDAIKYDFVIHFSEYAEDIHYKMRMLYSTQWVPNIVGDVFDYLRNSIPHENNTELDSLQVWDFIFKPEDIPTILKLSPEDFKKYQHKKRFDL